MIALIKQLVFFSTKSQIPPSKYKLFLSFILFLFVFEAIGQRTKSTVKTTIDIDQFSESTIIRTERWARMGEDKTGSRISANMVSIDGLTGMHLSYTGDLGCLSQNRSRLLIKLTNGDIIELMQTTITDCTTNPSATFWPISRDEYEKCTTTEEIRAIIDDNVQLLKQYDWETIRIHGSRYFTDIFPNPRRRINNPEQFFRQHIMAIEETLNE